VTLQAVSPIYWDTSTTCKHLFNSSTKLTVGKFINENMKSQLRREVTSKQHRNITNRTPSHLKKRWSGLYRGFMTSGITALNKQTVPTSTFL